MTIGRRGFLMAGSAVAGAGMLPAAQTFAAPIRGGRSITDFGVLPNSDADQTEALQNAIEEITASGYPVFIPSGRYYADNLVLGGLVDIAGVPGATELLVNSMSVNWRSDVTGSATFSGLHISTGATETEDPMLRLGAVHASICNCFFFGSDKKKPAISIEWCPHVTITATNFARFSGASVKASNSNLSIISSRFDDCGIGVSIKECRMTISGNQISECKIGVAADDAHGTVNGNVVSEAKDFGLKLGTANGKGSILAQGNLLQDCRVGIGVTSAGDDIFASLNMIKGAKDSAIRAFDGDRLVGPDLAIEPSESYLNLTIVGNVAR